jgi:pyruvate,orthophosphate dikinase
VINEKEKMFQTRDGQRFAEGDSLSLDGSTGQVYSGTIATVEAKLSGDFATIMEWADEFRTLKIRTNADTIRDAAKAVELGAEGIGLCRTEHMFFESDRIFAFRQMIVRQGRGKARAALEKIRPKQRQGFHSDCSTVMRGKPVTIRLLDPPSARIPADRRRGNPGTGRRAEDVGRRA